MTTERRSATEEEARALASTLRLRILRLCLDVALTNKELAERLDRDPASVLHHVRTLVRTGFLVAEPERRGARGSREVPYRSTGKSWIMDVADEGGMGIQSRTLVQAFVEDVHRIGTHNVNSTRMGLRLTPAEHEELSQRLYDLVEEFRTRESDGEPFSLFTALHRDDRPV